MPSVSDEEVVGQVKRVASVSLPSLASQPGNIDVSSQGSIALLTAETIHIFTPAINTSALLKPDISLVCHHDPTQKIPFFRSLIQLKTIPPDVSKAGSALDAFMLAYEPRFMAAIWSPNEIGPFLSPILAVLTTQSQIVLYIADTNMFKGPWRQLECLVGNEKQHIISMSWVAGVSSNSWLLAGTRRGEIIVYRVGATGVEVHSVTPLADGEITSIVVSSIGFLFLTTTKGISIAQFTRTSQGITLQSSPLQPPPFPGAHVSIARWHATDVLYCTPGEVHHYDALSGSSQNTLLESSDDDESCSFRPAVAITPMEHDTWEVYLNDGTLYHISQSSLKKESLQPVSYLPPPNDVIGSLQRQVEAAQGLFAKCDDGAGLSFFCHDGNQIASWSYYREPKCQFGIALTQDFRSTQELSMATHLLEAALNGDARHLRTFAIFYKYSASSKAKIWILATQALLREIESRHQMRAALRLSVWMQSEEPKDTGMATMHEQCLELSLAEALCHRIESHMSAIPSHMETEDSQHCTRLAKVGYVLSVRVKHDKLQTACQLLMQSIDKYAGLNTLSDASSIDFGEKCKACGSSVTFQTDNMLYAKCSKGHVWKRCATSLALLTSSANRCCSICSSETMQPSQATSNLQRHLIESITSCDLCSGIFFL